MHIAKQKIRTALFCTLLCMSLVLMAYELNQSNPSILFYTVDLKKQHMEFYWKDKDGEPLKSIQRLKEQVEQQGRTLVFAMNGGMFNRDYTPQGIYIQNHQTFASLDTGSGNGNFYLKPNGVFYITDNNTPVICTTTDFIHKSNIKYATQSGPLLLVNGQIHPALTFGSTNLNIRNGVGILPNNNILFAMSKDEINFYDFAKFFQDLGCKNALYLDGFVSRTYLPEKNWIQLDGNFGVMIGVTQKATSTKKPTK